MTRIGIVVIHAIWDILACGCIHIPNQQAVEIVSTIGAGLGNQRKVWRHRTIIIGTGLIIIPIWPRNDVGRTRRTHEHLAIFIWTIHDFVISRDRLDLSFVVAKVSQIAECNIFEAMAAGADFTINLKSTLHGRLVVVTKRTREAPVALHQSDVTTTSGKRRTVQAEQAGHRGDRSNQKLTHQAAPFAVASTGSEIDFGSGFVVSNTLSIGRMIRKCRKYQAVAMRESTT